MNSLMQLTEYKYPNFSVSQIGSVFHFNQTRLIYHGSLYLSCERSFSIHAHLSCV